MRARLAAVGLLAPLLLAACSNQRTGEQIDYFASAVPTTLGFEDEPERQFSEPTVESVPVPATAPATATVRSEVVEFDDVLQLTGMNEVIEVACDLGDVHVLGMANTITLTGECMDVVVSGMENVITIEWCDILVVNGVDNKVTYLECADPKEPQGRGNVVEQVAG